MSKSFKLILLFIVALLVITISVNGGSVKVQPFQVIEIIMSKFNGTAAQNITTSIIWEVRLPRVLESFTVGCIIAVSGTVMQSLLNNSLASTYTLGISSGASLGAAIMMILGVNILGLGRYSVSLGGLLFGLLTVFVVLGITKYSKTQMNNQTIVLVGMVVSMFANAMLTMVSVFSEDYLKAIVFWQLGSFAGSSYQEVGILLVLLIVGLGYFLIVSKELDIFSLGEEQALATGVDIEKTKMRSMLVACVMTGTAISFVGVIGFVDLVAPHLVRKMLGSHHRGLIPGSAILGGIIMVLSDLLARTLFAPREIPIGAITALIGAPFFAYLYLKKGRDFSS